VIPQYPDSRYRLPQAEQEAQWLEQHFGATAVIAQPAPVRQELSRSTFDLLHFAGHGLADQDTIAHAKLMLEGRMDNDHYVPTLLSATTVEQYCNCNRRDRHERPMVVLNACQIGREGYCLTGIGGFAQAFLKGGAGVFVGTLWSLGDSPARLFTETLYTSLLDGKTLSESTTAARHAAQQAGGSTWLAYVVYGHPHLKLRPVNDQM
jgi:CHAT domain-containing protein